MSKEAGREGSGEPVAQVVENKFVSLAETTWVKEGLTVLLWDSDKKFLTATSVSERKDEGIHTWLTLDGTVYKHMGWCHDGYPGDCLIKLQAGDAQYYAYLAPWAFATAEVFEDGSSEATNLLGFGLEEPSEEGQAFGAEHAND